MIAKVPVCPYCYEHAELVTGAVIYPKRPELASKQFWRCAPCQAHVGCHPGTMKPLGRLSDTSLRTWKMRAHQAFDPFWQAEGMTRKQAYQWLADQLGLNQEQCHIGLFDVAQCQRVVEVVTAAAERRAS